MISKGVSEQFEGGYISLTNKDAARAQLTTAIELWFNEKDPVSIQTLACAAYEIFHKILKMKNGEEDELFHSPIVKDEYREEYIKWLRRPANFFKHPSSGRQLDAHLQFSPKLSEAFILFSILQLEKLGERKTPQEKAFTWFTMINHPEILTNKGLDLIAGTVPRENIEKIRAIGKQHFLEAFVSLCERA